MSALFCMLVYNAPAQQFKLSQDVRFNNYTARNNFVSVYTTHVIRTRKGYTWVSGLGLYRFDGKKYIHYNAFRDDHHQFKVHYITNLLEDRYGRVWVSGSVLSYFDEQRDRFTSINIDPANKVIVAYGLCIVRNKLWFTSDNGLYGMDLDSLTPRRTSLRSNPDYPLNYPLDSNTIIHAGYSNRYFIYHIGQDKYDSLYIPTPEKMIVADILKMRGKLWFSTSSGLWCADSIYGVPRHMPLPENLGVSKLITVPAIGGDSILFIGTDKNGLIGYNINRQQIQYHYTHNENDPYSLSGNEVNGMFADSSNIFWICTNNGLCAIDPVNQYYKEKLLPDQFPIKVVQDSYDSNIVWLSIHLKGLVKMDWAQKKELAFIPLSSFSGKVSLGEGIYDMQQVDKCNWLLLGQTTMVTWNSCSGKGQIVDKFPVARVHRSLLLRAIIPHNKDSCFIACNNGLYLFHINSHKVDTAILRHDFTRNTCDFMSGANDGNGTIWAAERDGLVKYNIRNGNRKIYRVDDSLPNGNFLFDVALAGDGRVITVGGGGVGILDTGTEKIRLLQKINGIYLSGGGVSVVGNIAWINTPAGILHLNLDTYTATFATPSSDGDKGSNFAFGKVYDEFVWLNRNRIVYFKPALLTEKPLPAGAIIEKIAINKQPFYCPPATLAEPLSYDQNTINFYFTAFDFNDPNGIQFRYKLEGLDRDWNDADGQREANYMHIPPGKYTFVVQSGSANGKWNTQQAALTFEIVPPYWQTLWFRILSALAFIGIVAGIAWWRIRSVRKEETKKTETNKMMAELEMKALRSQMNPHFIFNSLNSIQKFIWENKQEDASEYLIKFSRLMRQILDNSMHKLVTLEQELSTLTLYIELEHRRSNNKFDYQINVGDAIDTAHILVPSLVLQPYVENSIWHGLLHKEERGELKVSILHMPELQEIRYIIEDNGVGRKKAMELRAKKGASYGMQITEQRLAIADQGGKLARIKVEDLYDDGGNGNGTRITIDIPITDFIKI